MIFINVGSKYIRLDTIVYVHKGPKSTKIVTVRRGKSYVIKLLGEYRDSFHQNWGFLWRREDKPNRYYIHEMKLWIRIPALEALEFFKKDIDGEQVFHARLLSVCKPIILRGQCAQEFKAFLDQRKLVI